MCACVCECACAAQAFTPSKTVVYQDMTRPISHYWIGVVCIRVCGVRFLYLCMFALVRLFVSVCVCVNVRVGNLLVYDGWLCMCL